MKYLSYIIIAIIFTFIGYYASEMIRFGQGVQTDFENKALADTTVTKFNITEPHTLKNDSITLIAPGYTEASYDSTINVDPEIRITTEDYYFTVDTLLFSDKYYPGYTSLNVYSKQDKSLFQKFKVDCVPIERGLWVDDFNFDGYLDVSLFEAYYSGANTSSLYFLWNNDSNKFVESEFYGTNLDFIEEEGTSFVRSINRCCGNQVHIHDYKLDNDTMVYWRSSCMEPSENDEMDDYECEEN